MAPLPPVEIKKPIIPIKTELVIPILVRYTTLLIFYGLTFFYFFNDSLQFIIFIGIFILNFFTLLFLYKDLLSNTKISQAIYNPSFSINFGEQYGSLLKMFIAVIFMVLLMQVSSIGIILAVFDYGKSDLNNYYSYVMTPPNTEIITIFKQLIKWTTIFIAFFAYVIIVSCSEDRVRALLINIVGLIVSLGILASGAYGIFIATKFLDIKKNGQQLYQ
jgi:hypothetical protein